MNPFSFFLFRLISNAHFIIFLRFKNPIVSILLKRNLVNRKKRILSLLHYCTNCPQIINRGAIFPLIFFIYGI